MWVLLKWQSVFSLHEGGEIGSCEYIYIYIYIYGGIVLQEVIALASGTTFLPLFSIWPIFTLTFREDSVNNVVKRQGQTITYIPNTKYYFDQARSCQNCNPLTDKVVTINYPLLVSRCFHYVCTFIISIPELKFPILDHLAFWSISNLTKETKRQHSILHILKRFIAPFCVGCIHLIYINILIYLYNTH